MQFIVVFVFCLLSNLTSLKSYGSELCGSDMCRCYRKRAICSGHNLTYIPIFPKRIRELTVTNANLTDIPLNWFVNLTEIRGLNKLNLTNNSIVKINIKVLSNVSVPNFILSYEPALNANIVNKLLGNMNGNNIRVLVLRHNKWKTIPQSMFMSFPGTKLERLYLDWNMLHNLDGGIYKKMKNLLHLSLTHNKIETVSFIGLEKLHSLDLTGNLIPKFPKPCNYQKRSTLPNLVALHLGYNRILTLPRMHCLPNLKRLSLEGNMIGLIPPNAFSGLPLLEELFLTDFGTSLKRIMKHAFNSSSLRYLSMFDTKFRFDKLNESQSGGMFEMCSNLEGLDLTRNVLPPENLKKLQLLLKPLKNIKSLRLQSTGLRYMPTKLFSNFEHLELLSLQANRIHGWENGFDVFGANTSLRHFDISANGINTVNDSSFPNHVLAKLKNLSMAHNPYFCTCDLMWFVNWLRDNRGKVVGYPSGYRCVEPKTEQGKHLLYFKPTKALCIPWDPLFTVAIVTCLCGFVLICSIIIILRCQANIKNSLYLFRVYRHRKNGYCPISNSNNFEYHAFVIYCDADRLWVHREFVKRLEENEGCKLCIHQRDFLAGEAISKNIDNFLEKSWKVVIIMSNEFAKSEWCQWEIDIVQERRRKQGRDVILLIMLKNISSKYMTSSVRTLLDSTPHLRYTKGVGEDLFWKTVTEAIQKPIGHPPTAIL